MRLSLIHLFKKTVPGHIFRGKRRLVKPVSKQSIETMRLDFERQEKIMLLLRHPYLTVEESSGHAKELQKKEKTIAKWTETQTLTKMKPHVTLEDRLNHLKVCNVILHNLHQNERLDKICLDCLRNGYVQQVQLLSSTS